MIIFTVIGIIASLIIVILLVPFIIIHFAFKENQPKDKEHN